MVYSSIDDLKLEIIMKEEISPSTLLNKLQIKSKLLVLFLVESQCCFFMVHTEQVKAHHFSVKILTSGPDSHVLAHGGINQ